MMPVLQVTIYRINLFVHACLGQPCCMLQYMLPYLSFESNHVEHAEMAVKRMRMRTGSTRRRFSLHSPSLIDNVVLYSCECILGTCSNKIVGSIHYIISYHTNHNATGTATIQSAKVPKRSDRECRIKEKSSFQQCSQMHASMDRIEVQMVPSFYKLSTMLSNTAFLLCCVCASFVWRFLTQQLSIADRVCHQRAQFRRHH